MCFLCFLFWVRVNRLPPSLGALATQKIRHFSSFFTFRGFGGFEKREFAVLSNLPSSLGMGIDYLVLRTESLRSSLSHSLRWIEKIPGFSSERELPPSNSFPPGQTGSGV